VADACWCCLPAYPHIIKFPSTHHLAAHALPLPPPAVGSLPAAIKAAAALAFVSAAVDLSGGRLVGTGMVDDGATPPRRIYPYNS
jgi:hypothetical protein